MTVLTSSRSRTLAAAFGLLLSSVAVTLAGCGTILGDYSVAEALSDEGGAPPPGDERSSADAQPGRDASMGAVSDGGPAPDGHGADGAFDAAAPRGAVDATATGVASFPSDSGPVVTKEAGVGAAPDPHTTGVVADGGGAEGGCAAGSTMCGGLCVSLTDIRHCGACARDCTALANVQGSSLACRGESCVYACAPGFADCADAGTGCATSLASSPNCGACGAACSANSPLCAPTGGAGASSCVSGCPPSTPTLCMGSCVDEQTSANACGGCGPGYACAAGKACRSGVCVGPILSISPTQYAFSTTTVGMSSASHAFVITNAGNGASAVLTASLTGTNATEFAIAVDGCSGAPLAAGASCTISLQFAPATRGPKSASLVVDGAQLAVALSATAADTVALTVTKSGAGSGTVSGDQIVCGTVCTEPVTRTTSLDPTITLTAVADAGSIFTGWSGGACAGTSPTCAVAMSGAQTVGATFAKSQVSLTLNFHVLGQPAAAVSSAPSGLVCTGQNCSQTASFNAGATVVLTVAGLTAGALSAWSNGCTGASCSVTLSVSQTISFTSTTNNLVFVTSTSQDGAFGGPARADATCASLASAVGLPGHFVAFMGTSTATAFSRLSGRGWIRPDGLPVADTIASLENSQLWYPPSLDETGAVVLNFVRTGQTPTLTCNDWTSNASTLYGSGGATPAEGTFWQVGNAEFCNSQAPFYCFGTDFNVPIALTAQNGLSTGRHVFTTVATFSGAFGGTGAADLQCQTEASNAGLANATRFKALLATTTASPSSRFDLTGAPWVRPDGVLTATTPTAFMNNTLLAPFSRGADATPNGQLAWIGTSTMSTVGTAANTCNNWSTASTASNGWVSYAQSGAPFGGSSYARSCDGPYALICLEN